MTDTPSLSAECRLVYRSADPGADPDELARLCAEVREWPRVVVLADQEMATAGLWAAIAHVGAPAVPEAIGAHLRGQSLVTAFRMQRLAQRLQDTVDALRARHAPVMLLKGAALGAMLDPTFRSRPMADLDLLVRPEDLALATEAITAAGWRQTTDPALLELLRDAHHQPPFYDQAVKGLRLELHTRMLPEDHSFAFEEEDLWRDAMEASAPFTGAWVPSVEHQLLHASTHFAWSHSMRFGAWRTFRTINALARAGLIDWTRVAAFARTSRAATTCYWTFRLAATLSGTAVPRAAMSALAPPTPRTIMDALERHFIAGISLGERPTCPSVRLEYLLWRMALRPRWSGHRQPGRHDPENRWAKAMGRASAETGPERVRRHLADIGRWWAFARRTLASRD